MLGNGSICFLQAVTVACQVTLLRAELGLGYVAAMGSLIVSTASHFSSITFVYCEISFISGFFLMFLFYLFQQQSFSTHTSEWVFLHSCLSDRSGLLLLVFGVLLSEAGEVFFVLLVENHEVMENDRYGTNYPPSYNFQTFLFLSPTLELQKFIENFNWVCLIHLGSSLGFLLFSLGSPGSYSLSP